jgi:transposase
LGPVSVACASRHNYREASIPRKSDEWRALYRRRSAVEREFGRLKHNYALAMLRVRASSVSGCTPI